MSRFPYYKGRPHIPLILEYGNRERRILPLLDSGADFSIFHRQTLEALGLEWLQGKKRMLDNADGSVFEAREFRLSVNSDGLRFPARICFADEPTLLALPLLGRMDIFDKFMITVCEHDQYVDMRPYEKAEK